MLHKVTCDGHSFLIMYHKLVYDTYTPHISRNKLSKTTEIRLIDTLNLILAKVPKAEQIDQFLLALLTPTERIMLAKRIAIIIYLKEGYSDSDISITLHVTRVTVSRLRYFYEARGSGYEVAFRVLENEKIMQEVKTALIKVAGYAIRAAGGRVKPTIL